MPVYSVQGLEQEVRNFEPVPAGVYNAIVADVEFGPFNSGQGFRLNITYEITDAQYQGRKVFDMIALQHSNADWAQSTQARLDALMAVNNLTSIDDWNQLKNLQCAIKIYIQKDKSGEYSDKNQVDLVLPKQSAGASMTAQPATTQGFGGVQPSMGNGTKPSLSVGTTPGYASGGPAPQPIPAVQPQMGYQGPKQ